MPAIPQSSNNYRFYQYMLFLLQKIPTRSSNSLLLKSTIFTIQKELPRLFFPKGQHTLSFFPMILNTKEHNDKTSL